MTNEVKTLTHFIGGQSVEGKTNEFGDVYNPSTGEVIAKVPFASADEVKEAIALAKEGQKNGRRCL